MATRSASGSSPRLRGLDIARGLVVAASAAMSHLPPGGFGWARHADWYGLTLLDLILPSFLTLFGAGIAIAYRNGVRWPRVIRRTAVLLILGLLFNAVLAGSFDLGTWRLTGVLVQFAIVGIVVTAVTRLARTWSQAASLAVALLVIHFGISLVLSQGCEGGIPQRGCNPSLIIDPFILGREHIYAGGGAGFEPEGIATLVGQTANVLFGYAAGALLWKHRAAGSVRALLAFGAVLVIGGLLAALLLPVGKRPWTPSFAAVSAAAAIGLLALMHVVSERLPERWPRAAASIRRSTWLLEAFGRNSLLIYFGKYMVVVFLARVPAPGGGGESIAVAVLAWVTDWSIQPQITYSALMFAAWASVAALLHWRRWYISA